MEMGSCSVAPLFPPSALSFLSPREIKCVNYAGYQVFCDRRTETGRRNCEPRCLLCGDKGIESLSRAIQPPGSGGEEECGIMPNSGWTQVGHGVGEILQS